jgi:FMN-dependent oxidoreductase (nitrilotriacetate monooxygenase family)
MHLLLVSDHSMMNQAIGVWRHPDNRQPYEFQTAKFWRELAAEAERGLFDAIFCADTLSVPDDYHGGKDMMIEHGVNFPMHDPLPLAPIIAGATDHLGVAVTLSTAGWIPYTLARSMATLAHLTEGRIAWNIVTSHRPTDFANLGIANTLTKDERYAHAQEFLEICQQLWHSYELDALVKSPEQNRFSDPTKVHTINYKGTWLSSAGPLNVMPLEPEREPVIFQAGASPAGITFAGRNADAVFSVQAGVPGMKRYSSQLREAAAAFGRNPRDVKICFGLQVIVGGSEAEAQEKAEYFNTFVDIEGSLGRLSTNFGVDLSVFDIDKPVTDLGEGRARGIVAAATSAGTGHLTLREMAFLHGRSFSCPQLVGTGDSIAEQMVALTTEGDGDGFALFPTVLPLGLIEFVDHVVPALQRRGVLRTEYTAKTLRGNLRD